MDGTSWRLFLRLRAVCDTIIREDEDMMVESYEKQRFSFSQGDRWKANETKHSLFIDGKAGIMRSFIVPADPSHVIGVEVSQLRSVLELRRKAERRGSSQFACFLILFSINATSFLSSITKPPQDRITTSMPSRTLSH